MERIARLILFSTLLVCFAFTTGAVAADPVEKSKEPTAVTSDKARKKPGANDFVIVDKEPELLYQQIPVFPEQATKEGVEGEVWVRALIGKDGKVLEAKIQKDSGLNIGFEKAALDAAHKNKYRPALSEGSPLAVWVSYKVIFKLQEKSPAAKNGR